jgi:hypothetical protein
MAVASGTYAFVPTSITHGRTAGGNNFDLLVASVISTGGVTGTATDSYTAAYSLTVSVAGVVDGHLMFISASGGLAGLHGEGTFTADTYSYSYLFAP